MVLGSFENSDKVVLRFLWLFLYLVWRLDAEVLLCQDLCLASRMPPHPLLSSSACLAMSSPLTDVDPRYYELRGVVSSGGVSASKTWFSTLSLLQSICLHFVSFYDGIFLPNN